MYRAADLAIMAGAVGVAAAAGRSADGWGTAPHATLARLPLNALGLAGMAVLWQIVLTSFGLYRANLAGRWRGQVMPLVQAVTCGTLLLLAAGALTGFPPVSRMPFLAFFSTVLAGTLVLRGGLTFAFRQGWRWHRGRRDLLIVGDGACARVLAEEICRHPEVGYRLIGFVDDTPAHPGPVPADRLGSLDTLAEFLAARALDEVIIALPVRSHYDAIARTVALCEEMGITVHVPVDFFQLRLAAADIGVFSEMPVVTLRTPGPPSAALAVKRALDVAGAAAGLLVTLPLLPVIALAIKLDSVGPVFFVQVRVGLHRRRFGMLKFRTMAMDAEAAQATLEKQNAVQGAAFKVANDPRVTRVGRILRKTNLDELPQLWNVLVGDMSLVGPRPLPVRDVERFQDHRQLRRFSVKPGLTCLWQVRGWHRLSFDRWMELDLDYIDNWSLRRDLDILARTVPAMIRGDGVGTNGEPDNRQCRGAP